MPISTCNISTDASRRETKPQGTAAFPMACYDNDLRQSAVPWHWHDEFECVVLKEGRASVTVDAEKTLLFPGEALFINTGRLHAVNPLADEPCRFISLVFHPRLVGGSPDSIFWQNYLQPLVSNPLLAFLHIRPESDDALQAIAAMENAWACAANATPGYEFDVRNFLSMLVYRLRRMQPSSNPLPSDRGRRDAERIKRMLSFIHDRYAGEITTREIARSASISETECLRCFRKTIDTTPIQYLRAYRLERAADLLRASTLRVAEIGAACGFQEMSYFAKSFRESYGCTPSDYRRQKTPPAE